MWVRSGCKKRLGASRWRFFASTNVSQRGRSESGVARYSSSWCSYTIGSLSQGPKLTSLTYSTSMFVEHFPKPCHLTPGLHMCSAHASATSDALQCWCTWHAGPGITTQLWEAEGHCNHVFFQLSTDVQVICFKLTLPETSIRPWKQAIPKGNFIYFKALIFRGYVGYSYREGIWCGIFRKNAVMRTPFCWNPLIWSPWRRSFVKSWRTDD